MNNLKNMHIYYFIPLCNFSRFHPLHHLNIFPSHFNIIHEFSFLYHFSLHTDHCLTLSVELDIQRNFTTFLFSQLDNLRHSRCILVSIDIVKSFLHSWLENRAKDKRLHIHIYIVNRKTRRKRKDKKKGNSDLGFHTQYVLYILPIVIFVK
jgi:hypothetical protein